MQYMIIFTEPESKFAERADPEKAGAYWGAWNTYIQAMAQAGVIVSGNGLMPPHTATTVRIRDGKRLVQDGPFAETKEMLGGYFIIETPDLDGAIGWAAQAPSADYGSVEVRPVMPPMNPT